jgi:hypothetical protein
VNAVHNILQQLFWVWGRRLTGSIPGDTERAQNREGEHSTRRVKGLEKENDNIARKDERRDN